MVEVLLHLNKGENAFKITQFILLYQKYSILWQKFLFNRQIIILRE